MSVNGTEIAIGQKWLTRGGQEVEVIDNDGDKTYPWDLSNETCVTNQGQVWEFQASSDDLDTLIQDEHGFTPWNGGECPVPDHIEIEAKLRCGDLSQQVAEWFDWIVTGHLGDIIAYRVVEQEVEPAKADAKEEPKYTVEQVFFAINEATADSVAYTNTNKVKSYLAKTQDPDYKLYLELKAKFE